MDSQLEKQERTPRRQGIKRVLLQGVFWRILWIEAVLLAWSLFHRAAWGEDTPEELFWYAVRIVSSVAVILGFMMLSLGRFLSSKVIDPLEAIARSNRELQEDHGAEVDLDLPADAPAEIGEIVATRSRLLETILSVSRERLRLAEFIRESLGRYLPAQVVGWILSNPEAARLGGELQKVSILMCDLRGFTQLSENLSPQDTVRLLNLYFSRMSEVIDRHHGMIDEFIGDAILALFGVPAAEADDAARAVACALSMQAGLAGLNRELTEQGLPRINMGIGVNTGRVVVGNIGGEKRAKFGIVGAAVNRTGRIQGEALGGEVLLSRETFLEVEDLVSNQPPRRVGVKGVSEPVFIYPVVAMGPPYNLGLSRPVFGAGAPLRLALSYWVLAGKKVVEQRRGGQALVVGPDVIFARLDEGLPLYTELKLRFQLEEGLDWLGDVYVKVMEVEEEPEGPVYMLRVTAVAPEDAKAMSQFSPLPPPAAAAEPTA